MDFGDHVTFHHMDDTFSMFPTLAFSGANMAEQKDARNVRDSAISIWIGVPAAPDIDIADKDTMFNGSVFRSNFGMCVI